MLKKLLTITALFFFLLSNVQAKSFSFRHCDDEYTIDSNCKSCKSYGKKISFSVNKDNGVVLAKLRSITDWSKDGKCSVVDENNFSCLRKWESGLKASTLNMFDGKFAIKNYKLDGITFHKGYCGY